MNETMIRIGISPFLKGSSGKVSNTDLGRSRTELNLMTLLMIFRLLARLRLPTGSLDPHPDPHLKGSPQDLIPDDITDAVRIGVTLSNGHRRYDRELDHL